MLLIASIQFFLDGFPQHALTFSMDEYNLLTGIMSVTVHHLPEFIQLIVQHIGIAHSGRIVQEFVNMQIHLQNRRVCFLFLDDRLRLRGLVLFFPLLVLHSRLDIGSGNQHLAS